MTNFEITDNARANASKIVNTFAGSPVELTRQLKVLGMRYVKVERGASVKYIIRGAGINRMEVKL